MTTITDIAKELGVSKSTVSKALNSATDISESMRKKVLDTAARLGYQQKKSGNKEKKLCIIVANMDYSTPNQFGYDIIHGFCQFAEADGYCSYG